MEALLQDCEACKVAQPAKLWLTLGSLVSRAKAAALLMLVIYSVPVSLLLAAAVVLLDWVRLVQSGRAALLRTRLQQVWERLQQPSSRAAPRGTALVSGECISASGPLSVQHNFVSGTCISAWNQVTTCGSFVRNTALVCGECS